MLQKKNNKKLQKKNVSFKSIEVLWPNYILLLPGDNLFHIIIMEPIVVSVRLI